MLEPKLCVRDLELVLAVASAGSTVKAAGRLNITQSAVSRGLLLAEEKLGTQLFQRGARGLQPTRAGRCLVEGSGSLLAAWIELEQRATAARAEPVRLRVACECYTAYRWLPSTLASLRERWPGSSPLDLQLAPEHTAEPVAALLAGKLEVALLTTSVVRAPLLSEPLFADEIVFLLSSAHPLAQHSVLTRRQLSETPLISSTHTPAAEKRWFLQAAFGKSKPQLEVLQFPLTEAIVDAARAGMGIAVLSEWIASSYLPSHDLVVKRLARTPLCRPWRIAYRREASAAATLLARTLETAAPRVHAAGPLQVGRAPAARP